MNAESKTRIDVEIYGTTYRLMGGNRTSANYIKRVAAHVNDHMHQISKGSPRLDIPRIAVLTAVNMADDFFKLQSEFERLQSEFDVSLQRQKEQHTEELRSKEAQFDEIVRQKESQRAMLEQEVEDLRAMDNKTVAVDEGLLQEHEKLKREYAKLQSEFDEWIELVKDTDAK